MIDKLVIPNTMGFEKNKDSLDAKIETAEKECKKEVSFQELLDIEMEKLRNKDNR